MHFWNRMFNIFLSKIYYWIYAVGAIMKLLLLFSSGSSFHFIFFAANLHFELQNIFLNERLMSSNNFLHRISL